MAFSSFAEKQIIVNMALDKLQKEKQATADDFVKLLKSYNDARATYHVELTGLKRNLFRKLHKINCCWSGCI